MIAIVWPRPSAAVLPKDVGTEAVGCPDLSRRVVARAGGGGRHLEAVRLHHRRRGQQVAIFEQLEAEGELESSTFATVETSRPCVPSDCSCAVGTELWVED